MRSILTKLKEDLSNLKDIIDELNTGFDDYKDDIKIDGKNIGMANIEQPDKLAYYDEIKVISKILVDYIELKVKAKRSQLLRQIMDHESRTLTDTAKDRLIDNDEEYLHLQKSYLEARELYGRLHVRVKAFEARGWSLTNLVKIHEKGLQNITLFIDKKDKK